MMGAAFDADLISVLDGVGSPGYDINRDWGAVTVASGARVMNGSFGFPAYPQLLVNGQQNPNYVEVDIHVIFPSDVLYYADNISRLAQADVVMVFGAGNDRAYRNAPPGEQVYWQDIQPYAANNGNVAFKSPSDNAPWPTTNFGDGHVFARGIALEGVFFDGFE